MFRSLLVIKYVREFQVQDVFYLHILVSGSKKFSLLTEQSTASLFALIIQGFSCSLCNQLNSFLRSNDCK